MYLHRRHTSKKDIYERSTCLKHILRFVHGVQIWKTEQSEYKSHILTVIMRNSISDCISWIKSHFCSRHTCWAPDPEDITSGQEHSYKHKHAFTGTHSDIYIWWLSYFYFGFINIFHSQIIIKVVSTPPVGTKMCLYNS